SPRYQRYCLEYPRDVPELCPGTENLKRFPDAGEPVTFTARVVNQGDQPAAATPFTWTLDAAIQSTGTLPALGAGQSVTLTWSWLWQSGPHTVTLALAALEGEVTGANNRLDHRTDAYYLEVLAHPYYFDAFAQRQNLVGSYSFPDWLQAQFAHMNQRLAHAVYPLTPDGLPDRVRIDIITATTELGGDIVSSTLPYDGRWTFRVEPDYRDTPENEAWQSAQRYAEIYANGIDWGLIHELTHQLGIIDLYQLNVSPSVGNRVNDREGLPLLSGFYWTRPGLMGGDQRGNYDGTYYSEHTAAALAQNSGFRRGYFGEYLYDLPEEIWLEALDRAGNPVERARVEVYQTRRNVVRAQPVIEGYTDAAGRFRLTNRPVSPTITTATGHTLAANPYGLIDVVGRNGQLLVRVGKAEQETFRWLPITELNKAAWRGQNAYTLTLTLPLADAPAPSAPHLEARVQQGRAELMWELGNQGSGFGHRPFIPSSHRPELYASQSLPISNAQYTYNIYRGLWPDYYPLRRIVIGVTGVTGAVFTLPLTRTARFAVTAVDEQGRESGFSNIVRAELLYSPAALAWEPRSLWSEQGQLLVVDGHSGALVRLLPPEEGRFARWLGRVGSEHIGMVGATAATLGPQGELAVALPGAQRVWLLDPAQQPLNWLGRAGENPSPLDRPAGALLAGEPFTVSLPLTRPDPAALLLLPFDGSLSDPDGGEPEQAVGLAFVPGRFGKAVEVGEAARLQYDARGRVDTRRGGVEFWVRPNWSGLDKKHHVLLEISDPARDEMDDSPGYRLRLGHVNGALYVWVTNFDDFDKAAWGDVAEWRAGEWRHVAATWDEQRLNLFVDGRLLWGESLRVPISGTARAIAVGSALDGEDAADAAFDSLRISAYPRLGNSADVRVLVSENRLGEVKILDLLGHPVSTYVPPDDGLHAYGGMVMAAGGEAWLVDEETGGVETLLFDGDALTRTGELPRSWEGSARALALSPDRILALAAGDRVFLLDPDHPDPPLAAWDAPNDGSSGPFREPVALAFGPNGDLAVAERGNRRISFIHAPLMPYRQFWPLWRGGG
ncbi:MAG: hypothetical protein GXP42_00820, partial [Chloroflexi bacterium]|nr:hypothetical protein [Chloroflexota bacterium]